MSKNKLIKNLEAKIRNIKKSRIELSRSNPKFKNIPMQELFEVLKQSSQLICLGRKIAYQEILEELKSNKKKNKS